MAFIYVKRQDALMLVNTDSIAAVTAASDGTSCLHFNDGSRSSLDNSFDQISTLLISRVLETKG